MRFETEQWKPVRNYQGLYEISNRGRIRALFKSANFQKIGRILKPWLLKTGYLQVHLKRPGEKRKAFCIHRLLLEAFVGRAPDNCEVRHLNGNRSDNAIANLAWGTHQQNMEDARKHNTLAIGERAGAAKLRTEDVITIRCMRDSGMPVSTIAQQFCIDKSNVSCIALRKSWKHI